MILSLLLCFQPSTFTGIAARRLGCSLVISALFDLTCLSFSFYSLKNSPPTSLFVPDLFDGCITAWKTKNIS